MRPEFRVIDELAKILHHLEECGYQYRVDLKLRIKFGPNDSELYYTLSPNHCEPGSYLIQNEEGDMETFKGIDNLIGNIE